MSSLVGILSVMSSELKPRASLWSHLPLVYTCQDRKCLHRILKCGIVKSWWVLMVYMGCSSIWCTGSANFPAKVMPTRTTLTPSYGSWVDLWMYIWSRNIEICVEFSGFHSFSSSTGFCALLTGNASCILCFLHFFWSVTVFSSLNVYSASTNEYCNILAGLCLGYVLRSEPSRKLKPSKRGSCCRFCWTE